MYESFFGLAKRPFTALPNPACFIPIDGIYQAYSSLAQCITDGRGIGVLTAPAGLGKTLVCQRLARELEDRFTVVFLPSTNFLTRRSLLQAILFELGHSYVRMGDQELRLMLTSVIRRLRPGSGTIALIVDEAHLLAPGLLEELRTLTNFADAGEPLVRLVISGQLSLEETLSQASLHAFNQRIGIQTTIESLTRDESAEYVTRRLTLAGANVTDVLTNEALATICEASDGSPRCLNQLCDHSLLLAFLASQKPVNHRTVHEALDDLKQLPLTWNEPTTYRNEPAPSFFGTRSEQAGTASDDDAWIVNADEPSETSASHDEVGALEFGNADESPLGHAIEFGEPDVAAAASMVITTFEPLAPVSMEASRTVIASPADADQLMDEEVVIDRYAALDAALSRLTRTMMCARAISRRTESVESVPSKPEPAQAYEEDEAISPAFDVVLPEEVTAAHASVASARSESQPAATSPGTSRLSGRRYELLFSELRRRRIGA
jgi:type II secretory pathway predicted ATPase ExeA